MFALFRTTESYANVNITLLILWIPEEASIDDKQLYSRNIESVKRMLIGIGMDIQATDATEITREFVLEKVRYK
jgi:cofilin